MKKNDGPGHWSCHRVLGAGAFGMVELWRNDFTKELLAVKKCKGGSDQLSEKQRERWIKEVRAMNSLHHPNVVATRPIPGQLVQLQGNLPVLCMEYCSRGDLRMVLNESSNCCGIKEREALGIMHDIASAVEYLHSQNLTHRDLKPENIVLQGSKEKTVYKLTDLGYVRELGEMSADASVVGTLNYLAPELLWKPKYTRSVDYWSLGILFYEIVTGTRPFIPNMPPTSTWMNYVMKKRFEDISAREENGRVSFSTEIESPSTISDCMRPLLTMWLRVALQWDPTIRGCRLNENGKGHTLVVFTDLKYMLSWKRIDVFAVSLYRMDTYAVNAGIRVGELQTMIKEKTGIEAMNQILSDYRGNLLKDPDSFVLEGGQDWSDLIVFEKDRLSPTNLPKAPCGIRRLLEKPRGPLDPETARRRYAASVFFLKQELDLFRSYVIALSVKIDLSSIELESIRGIVQNLTTEGNNFMTELTNFAQSSDYMLMSEESRISLETTRSKLTNLLENANQVVSKLDALTRDFEYLKTFSEKNWLERWTCLHEEATSYFESHTTSRHGRREPPVEMIKLLYKGLKLREEQFRSQEIVSFVSWITEFDRNILQLRISLDSFQALVDHYRKKYEEIVTKHRLLEQQNNSCHALVDSITASPIDTVIFDNIFMRHLMESIDDYSYPSIDDIGDLDW